MMRWFWRHAPRHHETVWSSFNEEDGIEVQAAPKETIKQPHLDNSVIKDTEWIDLY